MSLLDKQSLTKKSSMRVEKVETIEGNIVMK